MIEFIPAYLKLTSADLKIRVDIAHSRMESCDLCARECHIDRLGGDLGTCKTGLQAKVSSFGAHFGEEDPLRGWNGSGTVFFSRCNMRCQFCQNHDISQVDAGEEFTAGRLATIMLSLQESGCHNINLVSPSHVVPQILEALVLASSAGLCLPLVYNTGGYDSLETLKLLDGVIDIYMPDMKYASGSNAKKYSNTRNYPAINRIAVQEMHHQVGDLKFDERGLAVRGLLVRHLVLPRNLAGTRQIVQFLAAEISPNTYLNLMDQYRPAYNAHRYPEINRPINSSEYRKALKMAKEAGLTRLDERKKFF